MTLRGKETSIRISNINRGNWECSITSSKWQSIETRWLPLSFASIHKNIWFLECISCFTSFWAALSYSFLMLPPLAQSPKERLKSVCNPWLLTPVICQGTEFYKQQSALFPSVSDNIREMLYLSCWENFPRVSTFPSPGYRTPPHIHGTSDISGGFLNFLILFFF